MLTKNLSPYAFGTKVCSRHPPEPEMTVVARGTYEIGADGTLTVVDDSLEREPVTGDLFYEDDRDNECIHASDFADFKLSAEVLLTGSCYAPDGRAVTDCPVEVTLGDWSKALHIFGDRRWTATGVSKPEPFEQMVIAYRNALGGPGHEPNPVGKGVKSKDLPNIELPDKLIGTPLDRPPPASFGPVHPDWEQRRNKVGTQYDKAWLKERAPFTAVDFDWRFHSAAPADQQLKGYLKGDEPFRLVNLHPDASRVDSALPGLRCRAFVQDVMGRFREVAMSLDTVLFAVDERRVTLTWRGVDPVTEDDLEDVAFLLLATEQLSEPPAEVAHYQRIMEEFADDPVGLKADLPPELLELAERMEAAEDGEDPYPDAPDQGNAMSTLLARKLGPFAPEMQQAIKEGLDKALTGANDGFDQTTTQLETIEPPTEQELEMARAGAEEPLGEVPAPADAVKEQQTKFNEAFTAPLADDFDDPPAADIPKPGSLPDSGLRRKMRGMLEKAAEVREQAAGDNIPAEMRAALITTAEHLERTPHDPGWKKLDPEYTPPVEPISTDLPGPGRNLSEQDLTGRDLRGLDLSGANLEATILTKANLEGANLKGAKLRKAILYKTILTGANLEGADLSRINAASVKAQKANLRGANLNEGFFEKANFEGADLRDTTGSWLAFARAKLAGAQLQGCALPRTDFRRADVREANFERADLTRTVFAESKAAGACFNDATLERATFAEADAKGAQFLGIQAEWSLWLSTKIDGADFSYASLADAHFTKSSATEATFSFANLRECRMYRIKLDRAVVEQANLLHADLCKARLTDTSFVGSNLYNAKFLGAQGKGTKFTNAILTMSTLERG
ncbi:MAG: hypothetical protein DRI90_05620 [Deltaproteobacteria bacterium]|nr:MAG: hypothetical protein DRI90_05620 [Deltaproteobacteria bacterium]